MTAEDWKMLAILLLALGTVFLVASQVYLHFWHKRIMNEI